MTANNHQSNSNVKTRSVRGTLFTVIAFGGSNFFRLASNIILTRILFPEAFGMMALVQVFIVALGMFSDTGVNTSIIQSKRGDDPNFLNTAWSIQIIRGVVLWAGAAALALPASWIYDEPMLALLLPVAGASAVILGFTTTNVATANRHLLLGRITTIDLTSQFIGLAITVSLAFWLQSVWALVFGNLIGTLLKVVFQHAFIPGIRNRLFWDKSAFKELFNFGKFIFLSTAITFTMVQGDKAILGAFISLSELGIYNIGYFLGSVPILFASAISGKVIFPLYRLKPIQESEQNRKNVFRARRMVIASALFLLVCLGYTGIYLTEIMYDERYALAGPVVVVLSLCLLPRLIISNYGAVLLAAGNSKDFFRLNLCTAILQTSLMFIGVMHFGILGVIAASGIALLLTYPYRIYVVRKYKGWDAPADLVFFSVGIAANGFACWLYADQIALLL